MQLLIFLILLSTAYETLSRIAGADTHSSQIVFLQTLIALPILCLVFRCGPKFGGLTRQDSIVMFVSALFCAVVGNVLWNRAILVGHLGTVSCIGVLPFEGVWGALLFRERISGRIALSWVGALFGIGLLLSDGSGFLVSGWAEFLALGSALGHTFGIAVRRFIRSPISDGQLAVNIVALELPLIAVLSAVQGKIGTLPGTGPAFAAVLAMGIVVAAMTPLMMKAVRILPLIAIGNAYLAKPALSFMAGSLLFGESATVMKLVGAGICLGAVYLGTNSSVLHTVGFLRYKKMSHDAGSTDQYLNHR